MAVGVSIFNTFTFISTSAKISFAQCLWEHLNLYPFWRTLKSSHSIIQAFFVHYLISRSMRITFLGTGSAIPIESRVQSGLLVEDSDRTLLIDCGSGVLHRLGQHADYESVRTVLISHLHPDHVHDIVSLLIARWLAGHPQLKIIGPPGIRGLATGFVELYDYLPREVGFEIREVRPVDGTFDAAGFDIQATQTEHSIYCLAYRINNILTYGADGVGTKRVAAFADGTTAFVHECSFPNRKEPDYHATPSGLGRALAAADADIDRVFLTHPYPAAAGDEQQARMAARVAEHHDVQVEFADDGLSIEL
jgi:ribonuclease BN (tRNA processing enzyme)